MPLFTDFYLIYDWVKSTIMGNAYIGYYPYPFYLFFSPILLIPKEIAAYIWLAVSIIILVFALKRKAIAALFYYPLIFHMYYNQVTIFFWGLYLTDNPIAIGLMSLKPQLLILALPKLINWFKNDIQKFIKFCITVIGIYIPSLILRPSWPMEFIKNQFLGNRTKEVSPSLWAVPVLLIIWIIILFIIRNWVTKNNLWVPVLLSINPFTKFYDFIFLLTETNIFGLIILNFGIIWIALNTSGDNYMWVSSGLVIYTLINKYISDLMSNKNANLQLQMQK